MAHATSAVLLLLVLVVASRPALRAILRLANSGKRAAHTALPVGLVGSIITMMGIAIAITGIKCRCSCAII